MEYASSLSLLYSFDVMDLKTFWYTNQPKIFIPFVHKICMTAGFYLYFPYHSNKVLFVPSI